MTSRVRLTLITAIVITKAVAWPSTTLVRSEPMGALHAAQQQAAGGSPAGQTATRLPDGRWLFVGGVGVERVATVWDPATQSAAPTQGQVEFGRAFHTATLLSDGTVLIVGGRNGSAMSDVAERFDPATGQFGLLPMAGTVTRAFH